MSSILTNNGAMVALQTLKATNDAMSHTQSMISTGKEVATAKDNSAVWAISKVMEADVKGFKGISDSLSLGESTVAVARQASETVTDLLTEMKGKIVSAQESNVDRAKLQADVSALRDQITSVVGAAQFNGLNLVNGSSGDINVLSSLDRDATGGVTASTITVAQQDLSVGGYAANDVFAAGGGAATVSADADIFTMSIDDAGADSITIQDGATAWAAGDALSLNLGDKKVTYTVTDADLAAGTTTADVVALGLKAAVDSLGIDGLTIGYDSAVPGELTFNNATGDNMAVTGSFKNAGSGALGALTGIDVSTGGGAQAALASIEGLITTAVDAASAFGSVQTRIETQSDFIGKLTDSLKSGIGSLVDADMEETSARLQALQVQQQLGVQSLSMANQAPQSVLSLFR